MTATAWTIRPAGPVDRPAILEVIGDAFAEEARGGREEVEIVLATWACRPGRGRYEYVAEAGGKVVGHVLGATGDLAGSDVVGVAPLSVVKSRQGQGIGSALMQELIRGADAAGLPLLVVLGSPDYYGRFGFEPASDFGITYPAVGAGDPHFMVRRLDAFDAELHGDFVYCWEH